LDFHFQSPYLTGDSLADIIKECHKAGIKVIARTDFSKIRRAIYEKNPRWAYRPKHGGIIDYEGNVHACLNSDYRQSHALRIIEECLAKHDFDGIFFNMGGYRSHDYSDVDHGMCYCEKCRQRFYEMFGSELPQAENWEDPVYRKYKLFQKRTCDEHYRRVAMHIKAISPDLLIDADIWTEESGMFRYESNASLARPLPHWQYSSSLNAKCVRGSFPRFISSNSTVDFLHFSARHTAVSPVLQETRLWQGIANGGHMDYYLIGRIDNHDDKSGFPSVIKAFSYLEKNADYYADNHSCAKIAMIASEIWGSAEEHSEEAGIYRILTEGHFLFDVILADRLSKIDLDKYRLLVLPELECLSDEDAAILDQFVHAGGKMLLTGKTGFRDADFEARKAPALKSSGMREFGITQSAKGAYFFIDEPSHDMFPRFHGVNLICVYGDYAYAEYSQDQDTVSLLRMIPPQPFGPPERCYPVYPAGAYAAAVSHRYGAGLCVTVPWNPGRLFYRHGHPNTAHFVLDVLETHLGAHAVKTDLPPMVEITLLQDKKKSYSLLHLINQTGHFGNSFYPPVPISRAYCTVPCPAAPSKARSLASDRQIDWSYAEGAFTVQMEEIGIFEAILIQ
jgi:hypothetical protein